MAMPCRPPIRSRASAPTFSATSGAEDAIAVGFEGAVVIAIEIEGDVVGGSVGPEDTACDERDGLGAVVVDRGRVGAERADGRAIVEDGQRDIVAVAAVIADLEVDEVAGNHGPFRQTLEDAADRVVAVVVDDGK